MQRKMENEKLRDTYIHMLDRQRAFVNTTHQFKIAPKDELMIRKERVEEAFVKYAEAHHKLIENLEGDELQNAYVHFATWDETYMRLKIELNRRINEVEAEEMVKKPKNQSAESEEKKERAIQREKPILESVRENDWNRVLYVDGTQRYLPLTKRAYVDVSSSEEEEEQCDSTSENYTVPAKMVKSDLRVKINEKTAQIKKIEEQIKERKDSDTVKIVCNNCGGAHKMHQCEKFLARNITERWRRVREVRVCQNCFMPTNDRTHRCQARPCKCGQRHNSLLCRG